MKSKIGKLGQEFRIGEDQIRINWRALWENWFPKDESHIPLSNLMEENCNFNGGIFFKDLQALTMEFGEDGFLGREVLWVNVK